MNFKKIISVILSFVVFFSVPLNLYAANNTKKDEIVYISVSPNGEKKGVYVVNGFSLEKDGIITDFGKYENIKNLSTLDEVKNVGDQITVTTKKGKFFYQGDNPNKEIPWNVQLKYYLDNKELSTKDILGKKGLITIKGSILKNLKADKFYSSYYIGQLQLSIDSKHTIVKEAKDATFAFNGGIQLLNYTVLPEKELNFEVKLESTDFQMNSFTFSAVPFNMNFDMPDINQFTDNLYQLERAISQIGNGSTRLLSGANQLNNNSKLLFNSLYGIYKGIDNTKIGQNQLKDGVFQFNGGLQKYSQGIDELVTKIGQLGFGMDQLKFGLGEVYKGTNQLNEGLKKYSDGITKYTNGVSKLDLGFEKYIMGIETMGLESKKLIDGGKKLVDGSSQILDGLSFFDKLQFLNELSENDMKNLKNIINEILNFWTDIQSKIENLSSEDLKKSLNKIKDDINNLIIEFDAQNISTDKEHLIKKLDIKDKENEDVKKLLDEAIRLGNIIKKLKEKFSIISNSINNIIITDDQIYKLVMLIKEYNFELNKKLLPLKKALIEFDEVKSLEKLKKLAGFKTQYQKFHNGLVEYTNGTNELVNGINDKLIPGGKEIGDGINKLNSNGLELLSGIIGLKDGSSKLNDVIKSILDRLNFGEDLSQVSQLKTGMDLLVENHNKILQGETDLSLGLNRLSSGVLQYYNGFGQYNNGFSQFIDGLSEFENGTSKLKNMTDGMTEKAKKEIDEKLKLFSKEGFKLKSFVNDKNENLRLVQFVYVSNAIEKTLKNEEKIIEKTPTFFEKLWDIITFWK
ncbi:hypothetical protein ABGF49_07185 [Helcococcus ovis]|uniref:YhgE/Pip domain-containing protein n=2 Tax=Helcococcus ovis TaxID=72026 RepID=A0A4R9C3I2_9FIRM|nr:hypothetical protein [Helcococcus ovis]TFF65612.1 hypothetical protein EQF92_01785 [Helcococcus ovis]TFF67494.1 hypothetical protein EQF91_00820 [Helcococcus ovis]